MTLVAIRGRESRTIRLNHLRRNSLIVIRHCNISNCQSSLSTIARAKGSSRGMVDGGCRTDQTSWLQSPILAYVIATSPNWAASSPARHLVQHSR